MTNDDDARLDELLRSYRAACPDVEASSNFMPGVWQKIESRHSFWFVFQRFARTATTGCAAICLLLVVLNFASAPHNSRATATYTDALLADHSAEKTYFTEAIPATPSGAEPSGIPRH
jgi:hypothetical protein